MGMIVSDTGSVGAMTTNTLSYTGAIQYDTISNTGTGDIVADGAQGGVAGGSTAGRRSAADIQAAPIRSFTGQRLYGG
jgi:hypothetical protein